MKNGIERRIKNIMSAVFELPVEKINDDSSSDTLESWSSLGHMNLIITLEEEFNISLLDKDVINMINYKSILHVINSYL